MADVREGMFIPCARSVSLKDLFHHALHVSSLGLPLLSPFSWAMKITTNKGQPRSDACKEHWMKQTL